MTILHALIAAQATLSLLLLAAVASAVADQRQEQKKGESREGNGRNEQGAGEAAQSVIAREHGDERATQAVGDCEEWDQHPYLPLGVMGGGGGARFHHGRQHQDGEDLGDGEALVRREIHGRSVGASGGGRA